MTPKEVRLALQEQAILDHIAKACIKAETQMLKRVISTVNDTPLPAEKAAQKLVKLILKDLATRLKQTHGHG